MTTTCPYCRTTVVIDAAGNSSCGHLRYTPPAAPLPNPAELAAPALPNPAEPAPPPAWPAPEPAPPPVYQQPAPPPAYSPEPAPPPVYQQPASQPTYQQPAQPVYQQPVQPTAVPGWQPGYAPPRKGRSGCVKGCGCVVVLAIVVVVVLFVLAVLTNGEFNFSVGTGDASDLPAENPALTGTVSRGEETVVGSGTSDPGSVTTLTALAGGPAAGVKLAIPGDAYTASTSFTMSATPIRLKGFGGLVTPASDLITVDNGGAYAASPVTVTVPVTIPAGSFAMGVYLRDDGTLEPMPLIDESPTSVTIATRHFSSFFITLVAEAALPDNIGTGFRAGEDDFQTPNYGTYIEPGGHCAGQSLAEMWYFAERKSAGAPQLNGLLGIAGRDETPKFWRDDRQVYRLASSISRDLDWETLTGSIELAFEKAKVDRLQWNAFRYAMLITGQPQFVGLSEGDKGGGHVIVAYAATPTGLWVADPNYPGKLRDIAWNEGSKSFTAYESGANAESSKHHYDKIAFYGKTALVEWSRIGARWAEVAAGTIGDDRFPTSSLSVAVKQPDGTETWEPLTDGMLLDSTEVRIGYDGAPGLTMLATLHKDETELVDIRSGTFMRVHLGYGINRLGVYFQAANGPKYKAVDFTYITVIAPGPETSVPSASPTATPAPSVAPRPTPKPEPTFNCKAPIPPSGIKRMEWQLHCQGGAISTPSMRP